MRRSRAGLRDLGILLRSGTAVGLTDGELLERFAQRHEEGAEAAFLMLVQRHGPMVLRICRETLRDAEDADDAFQATFLVLVRRAGSIRRHDALGSWLYGVALRVSACARASAARRRVYEKRATDAAAVSVETSLEPDTRAVLLEEVGRLPEKYRAPVVLCYLEGLTHETVAERLGWPVGTVRSRLSGARERLRIRLTRRGLAPSAVLLAAGLSAEAASVPSNLLDSTIRIAIGWTERRATTAGSVSAAVATLTEDTLKELAMLRLKSLAMGLLVGVAVLGAGLAASQRLSAADRAKGTTARRTDSQGAGTARRQVPPLPGPAPVQPGDTILIEVLEALPGRPISGERLVRPDGTVGLGFYGDLAVAGLTRGEIKVKVISHLRKFLPDDVLGLREVDDNNTPEDASDDKVILFEPVDSDRVFVDDHFYKQPADSQTEGVERKLDKILKALEEKTDRNRPALRPESDRDPLDDHERRLGNLERKLDEVVRRLERWERDAR